VGDNLQDHLQIRMVWKVKGPTLNERASTLLGKAAMGLEYLLFKTGPLTMPPSQLGAFAKTDASEPTPNVEWHVQPLSLDKFGDDLHPFPRDHAVGVQPAADLARPRAPRLDRSGRRARDPAELPVHRRGPCRGGEGACA
jgi:choline dehydrogenase-like flavoprotein